jgi:hypothetical protein
MGFLLPKFIIFLFFFIRLTIHCSRLTVFRNEIATSFNQKTVDHLAMTEQEKIQIPLTPFAKKGNDSWVSIFILIWYC